MYLVQNKTLGEIANELEKRLYDSKTANNEYRTLLQESREGFNLTMQLKKIV